MIPKIKKWIDENLKNLGKSKSFLLIQIVLLFLSINFIVSGLRCRLDVSDSGRFELTESSLKILNNLNEIVYIDAYFSSQIPSEYKARFNLMQEMLKEIQSIRPSYVKLRFYDPDSSEEYRDLALNIGITPQILQKVEAGSTEAKDAFLGLSIRMGNQVDVIPFTFYAEEIEYQVLSSIKKITRKKKSNFSSLAILSDSGAMKASLPGSQSGKDTFGIFIYQFFVKEFGEIISLRLNEAPIPQNIHTLLIVGAIELNEQGIFNLDQFLMRGGNIILLPKTMDFQMESVSYNDGLAMSNKGLAQTLQRNGMLDELLFHYGIKINSDMVLDPNLGLPIGSILESNEGYQGRYHYPLWLVLSKENQNLSQTNSFTKNLEYLLMPWSHSISYDDSKQTKASFDVFLESTNKASTKEDYLYIGEKEVAKLELKPVLKKIPLGLHVKGNLQSYFQNKDTTKLNSSGIFLPSTIDNLLSQIIIIGSPYIISDLLVLPEYRDLYQSFNVPFLMNLYDILDGEDGIIEVRSKKSIFEPLNPFSPTEKIAYNIINLFLLPFCISIYSFIRIYNRNRHRNK
jgi:ABC-type uncharacterized transport system involved in gliding motility auxiliary subunit